MKKLLVVLLLGACVGASAQPKIPYGHRTHTSTTSRRTEIILPQVKGLNCYKADFHVHTSYSDGQVSPAGREIGRAHV